MTENQTLLEPHTEPNTVETRPAVLESPTDALMNTIVVPVDEEEGKVVDDPRTPHYSLFNLFKLFLWFGLNAWGGPAAQISLLRERLVDGEKWTTNEKFFRVMAVYQVLPGPEATELCCYFGYLSRGRIGSFVAGMGFILPGFALMLLCSWLYSLNGLNNIYFASSFKALNVIVTAMVARAVHKLGSSALADPKTSEMRKPLLVLALLAALNSCLHLNFFITLAASGIFYTLYHRQYKAIACSFLIVCYAAFIVYLAVVGMPSEKSLGLGIAPRPEPGFLFALGLMGGLVSFGGAYTSVPFLLAEAVSIGGWMTRQTFLDGIAIGNILPAPLVIFSTFVGFVGGESGSHGEGKLVGTPLTLVGYGFLGAILCTIGMFIPCFSFTIIGHPYFERLVNIPSVLSFLDGVTGSIIGVIAVTALDLLRGAINSPTVSTRLLNASDVSNMALLGQGEASIAGVLYMVTLALLYAVKDRNLVFLLILGGAIAGQILFRPQ